MSGARAPLEGDLEFFPVFDLLQWLEQAGKTGMLRIEGPKGDRNVCLREGRIIFASSRCAGQRFGEFLAIRGSISEDVLREALEESRREGITFTRILIDRGVVSREVLETAVFELIQSILEGLYETEEATLRFSFVEHLPSIVSEGVIQFQSAHLIMETVRRLDERKRDAAHVRLRCDEVRVRLMKGEFAAPVLPDPVRLILRGSEQKGWWELVLADTDKCARIMHIAASGVFENSHPPPAGQTADWLRYLGAKTVAGMLIAFDLRSIVPAERNTSKIHDLLSLCIRTAFVSHVLAEPCRLDPGAAFLAGLLHEMGKAVILNLPECGKMTEDDLNLLLTGVNVAVGESIAERWGLPRAVQSAVRYQNSFRMAGEHRLFAALVRQAHNLVSSAGGLNRNAYDADIGQVLGLSRDIVENRTSQVLSALAKAF